MLAPGFHPSLADVEGIAPKKKTRISKKKDEDEDEEEEEEEPEPEEEEEDEPEPEPEEEDSAKEDANGSVKKAPGAEKDRKVKTTKADEPVPVVAAEDDDEE